MRIAIIGPGRVGTALGQAFKSAGFEIVLIVSLRREDAEKCMSLTGCKHWSSSPQDAAQNSDIVLITVPDSQIKNVAEKLADRLPPETLVVHTSGTLGSSILGAKRSLSMHPIASFTGGKLLPGTYFGIEGEVEAGKELVHSINGKPIVVSQEFKALYHAGLNFGAAYLLTLLDTGAKLLAAAGIEESEEVILSLASSALENSKRAGIRNALTGPIERGDVQVVEEEIKAIQESAPEVLDLYRMLTEQARGFLDQTDSS